jgi:membrane protein implicated in regulation of membrane protease activity
MKTMGNVMIAAGLLLIAAGLLYKAGWLSWFGRLPGDIAYESENVRIYIPLVTTLLLSVILTLILWVMRRL